MLTIRGSGLTAEVLPERGAKIVSLRDDSGREWLAQSDPSKMPTPDASFVDAEMAGWDECAPSIVACTVDGRAVPDHGDLWNVPFSIEGEGSLAATGTSLGYRFTRSIRPTSTGLQLSYAARALDRPVPFLWAAHPQFSAPPGTRVELPEHVSTVIDVLDPSLPSIPLTREERSIGSLGAGQTRKWYVEPEQKVGMMRLVRRDGSALEMTWSHRCPYVGVWFDNQGFSREPVIAIEPSTGFFDSVATASAGGRIATLTTDRELAWWVRLRRVDL